MQQINPRNWPRLYLLGSCLPQGGLPAVGRLGVKKKSAQRRRDAKKKIDPFASWRLCEQKKKISPSTASDEIAIKKKLARHRQGVKKNNSSLFMKGTLSLTFAL